MIVWTYLYEILDCRSICEVVKILDKYFFNQVHVIDDKIWIPKEVIHKNLTELNYLTSYLDMLNRLS